MYCVFQKLCQKGELSKQKDKEKSQSYPLLLLWPQESTVYLQSMHFPFQPRDGLLHIKSMTILLELIIFLRPAGKGTYEWIISR